jgi:hypothetical protein
LVLLAGTFCYHVHRPCFFGLFWRSCWHFAYELQGKKRFDLDPPRGPFGTHVRCWSLWLRGWSVKLLSCKARPTISYSVCDLYCRFFFSTLPGIIILTARHLLCLKSLCFCSVFHCSLIVQDAPAIVESHYDVRIVGCSGGVGGKHLGLILHAKFELQWDNLVGIVYEHDVHIRELLEIWHGDSLLTETTDALDWRWHCSTLKNYCLRKTTWNWSGWYAEDEHDVTWFHLEKGKLYECPVCTQVFQVTTEFYMCKGVFGSSMDVSLCGRLASDQIS